MTYMYEKYDNAQGPYTVVNLFTQGQWRMLAVIHIFCRTTILLRKIFFDILFAWKLILYLIWSKWRNRTARWPRKRAIFLHPLRRYCLSTGKRPRLCAFWWEFYLMSYKANMFEQDYIQAWHDRLAREGTVVWINIFLGNESLRVPLCYDRANKDIGNDRHTFEMLRMWYSWLQFKRGFGEIILPKRLLRIVKVKTCDANKAVPVMGDPIKSMNFGRSASSHVANFENPENVPEEQRYQTADIVEDPAKTGLEFVRTWDTVAVSLVSIVPFGISLVFAGLWIGLSVGLYEVNAQVATQTAFTVSSFIVTAGALLIALFAFLDSQAQSTA